MVGPQPWVQKEKEGAEREESTNGRIIWKVERYFERSAVAPRAAEQGLGSTLTCATWAESTYSRLIRHQC